MSIFFCNSTGQQRHYLNLGTDTAPCPATIVYRPWADDPAERCDVCDRPLRPTAHQAGFGGPELRLRSQAPPLMSFTTPAPQNPPSPDPRRAYFSAPLQTRRPSRMFAAPTWPATCRPDKLLLFSPPLTQFLPLPCTRPTSTPSTPATQQAPRRCSAPLPASRPCYHELLVES